MLKEIHSAAEFDEAIPHGKVLVDFNATWCGPCQMLKPSVEALGKRSYITVLSVDVDENPDLASRYGVSGIPTLFLFEEGKEKDTAVGFLPEPRLKAFAKID